MKNLNHHHEPCWLYPQKCNHHRKSYAILMLGTLILGLCFLEVVEGSSSLSLLSPLSSSASVSTTTTSAVKKTTRRILHEGNFDNADGDGDDMKNTPNEPEEDDGHDEDDNTTKEGEGQVQEEEKDQQDKQDKTENTQNGDATGNGDGDGGGDSHSPKGEFLSDTTTTTTSTASGETCASAKTCEACVQMASKLFGSQEAIETCAWQIGSTDAVTCEQVSKDSVAGREGDQCSGTTTSTTTDKSPTKTSSSGSLVGQDDDEGSLGSIIGAIFGLIFILGCGVFGFKKFKDKFLGGGGPGITSGIGSMGGGPFAKTAKYQEVAREEDDEEWGWGDDEDGGGGAGDVELAGGSFRDDTSVHKRRGHNSNDSSPSPPNRHHRKPSPTTTSTSNWPQSSPLPASGGKKTHASLDHSVPSLPPPAPNSGGLSLNTKGTGTGMSLMGKHPVASPSIAKPPMHSSSPAPTGNTVPPPSPMSAPLATFPTNNNNNDFGGIGVPQRITSLGSKKPVSNTAATPKKPVAPSPEDDIFASMGLAAQPKFSHAPAPASTTSAARPGASRWNQPPAMSTTTTRAAAPFSAPKTNLLPTGTSSFEGGGEDGDKWDDDADLDDLLDD